MPEPTQPWLYALALDQFKYHAHVRDIDLRAFHQRMVECGLLPNPTVEAMGAKADALDYALLQSMEKRLAALEDRLSAPLVANRQWSNPAHEQWVAGSGIKNDGVAAPGICDDFLNRVKAGMAKSGPTCQECGDTGIVNTFEPSPTNRGETGDMENWPGPCPKCSVHEYQAREVNEGKRLEAQARHHEERANALQKKVDELTKASPVSAVLLTRTQDLHVAVYLLNAERSRLRALVLRILGFLSNDDNIVIPAELPDNFEETVMSYIVGHDENREKAQQEAERLRREMAQQNNEWLGHAAPIENERDALRVEVSRLNTLNNTIACEYEKENKELGEALDALAQEKALSMNLRTQSMEALAKAEAEVKRLGVELDKQCQAHHAARERFKDEIKAVHAARAASAEGYRDTIKEIAAERDALKTEVGRFRPILSAIDRAVELHPKFEARSRADTIHGLLFIIQELRADVTRMSEYHDRGPVRHQQELAAANAERDAALARAELAEQEVSNQTYRGNSVSYWHQKAETYGNLVSGIAPKLRAKDNETLVDAADRFVKDTGADLRNALSLLGQCRDRFPISVGGMMSFTDLIDDLIAKYRKA